jgi:L-aspartate oxidase
MVFAPRAVEALLAGRDGPAPTGAMRAVLEGSAPFSGTRATASVGRSPKNDPHKAREGLQRAMTEGAGVVRTEASLAAADAAASDAGDSVHGADGVAAAEVRNLATVAGAVVAAATARTESRGCHWRADFPEEDPAQRRRLVLR